MRIDKVYIKEFKNLKEFSVELDTEQLTNVFIGKNGAGKSNFIEALVIIFRDLDLKTVTIEFSYEIEYYCKNVTVNIKNDSKSRKQLFYINHNKVTKKHFMKSGIQMKVIYQSMYLHITLVQAIV